MVADFRVWDAAMTPKGLLFDVYSSEAKAPDSKAAYDAFPEHSEINFAVAKFLNGRLSEFTCIRPKETKFRDCMDLVGLSGGRQQGDPDRKKGDRGDVYPIQKH